MVMSENLDGLLLELWTLVYKINQSTESTGGGTGSFKGLCNKSSITTQCWECMQGQWLKQIQLFEHSNHDAVAH